MVTFKKCYKSLIVSSLSNVGWEWNVNPNCPHIFRRLDTAHLRTIRRTRSVQHVYFGAREARGIGPKNFSTVFFFYYLHIPVVGGISGEFEVLKL